MGKNAEYTKLPTVDPTHIYPTTEDSLTKYRDRLIILLKYLFTIAPITVFEHVRFTINQLIHAKTYKPPTQPFILHPSLPPGPGSSRTSSNDSNDSKNIVIVGAALSGYFLAKQLSSSLPSGYRLVIIEKNDRFHHIWNFPRYSALPPDPSHAIRAFVPYDECLKSAPEGAVEWVRGEVVDVVKADSTGMGGYSKEVDGYGYQEDGGGGYVVLKTGEAIEWEYLVVATGSMDSSKVKSIETSDACAELKARAQKVAKASRIVVIGGGAVGVEFATDVKSQYGSSKTVTLIHSGERLLNRFGVKLHEEVMKKAYELELRVILGVRASVEGGGGDGPGKLTLPGTGEVIEYDLIVWCTGGNSIKATTPFRGILPESDFNPINGRIITRPTLQSKSIDTIYALGDVCDPEIGVEVPKMGRAAYYQAKVVSENIVTSIKNTRLPYWHPKQGLKSYCPMPMENAIKLTVGITQACAWMAIGRVETTFPITLKDVDLDARHAWDMFGEGKNYPAIDDLRD